MPYNLVYDKSAAVKWNKAIGGLHSVVSLRQNDVCIFYVTNIVDILYMSDIKKCLKLDELSTHCMCFGKYSYLIYNT